MFNKLLIMLLLALTTIGIGSCTFIIKPQFDLQGNVKVNWYDVNKSLSPGRLVKLDDNGNIYIIEGLTAIKYNPDGEKLWLISNATEIHDTAFDSQYNIFTAGYFLVKLNPNGKRIWSERFQDKSSTNGFIHRIALDRENNIIAVGTLSYGDIEKYGLIKYSNAGDYLWSTTFSNEYPIKGSPGNVSAKELCSISVDSKGNIIVSYYRGTIKYNRDGKQLWFGEYGGDNIVVDSLDNIYVTGWYCTAKYDSNGTVIWSTDEKGAAIVLDNLENIYVTLPIGYDSGKTIKYDHSGQIIWVQDYGGDFIYIDDSGGIYVPASKDLSSKIIKFDSDGNIKWTIRLFNPTVNFEDLTVDKIGNVIATGSTIVGHRFDDDSSYGYITVKYSQY